MGHWQSTKSVDGPVMVQWQGSSTKSVELGHEEALEFVKTLTTIKTTLGNFLYDGFDGVVQTGPFAGLKLLHEISWGYTYFAPFILGCYEQELHPALLTEIERLNKLENPVIAVLGCAEGYYAVGMKCRVPKATVYVVDIDKKALDICGRTAAANNVAVIAMAPIAVIMDNPDLLIVDVEGHEVLYLDLERFPGLLNTSIIVEIHQPEEDKDTSGVLVERFKKTHRIIWLREGPRDPSQHLCFAKLSTDFRWLAVSESRPYIMTWLVMIPRERAAA